MKSSIDTTAFGCLWPGIPSQGYTRHTRLDLPQMQERKMLGCHFILLKEDLEAVQENITDDGHCKTKGIRKAHGIIAKSNKPNSVKAYSSSLLHVIFTHNHLPFFKTF